MRARVTVLKELDDLTRYHLRSFATMYLLSALSALTTCNLLNFICRLSQARLMPLASVRVTSTMEFILVCVTKFIYFYSLQYSHNIIYFIFLSFHFHLVHRFCTRDCVSETKRTSYSKFFRVKKILLKKLNDGRLARMRVIFQLFFQTVYFRSSSGYLFVLSEIPLREIILLDHIYLTRCKAVKNIR